MLKGVIAVTDKFLADLGRIQQRSARVQNQISSGQLLQRSSDAPERVAEIFRLKGLLDHNTQVDANLSDVQVEVNVAESAMRQVEQLLERVNVLGTQTAGDTANVNRPAVAIEVKQIFEQLVTLTRTSAQGRYVFSGDLDRQLLYQSDPAQPTGALQLATATTTRLVEDVQGGRFSVSQSAHEIFDARDSLGNPTTNNVFAAVNALIVALDADDQPGVVAAMPQLSDAIDHINNKITFYGNAQNRAASAVNAAKQQKLMLATQLADLQDTDLAAAAVEFNMSRTFLEAALAAHARMPRSSLFDYLG